MRYTNYTQYMCIIKEFFDVRQISVNRFLYGKDDQEFHRYESPLSKMNSSPGANYGEEEYIDKQ